MSSCVLKLNLTPRVLGRNLAEEFRAEAGGGVQVRTGTEAGMGKLKQSLRDWEVKATSVATPQARSHLFPFFPSSPNDSASPPCHLSQPSLGSPFCADLRISSHKQDQSR